MSTFRSGINMFYKLGRGAQLSSQTIGKFWGLLLVTMFAFGCNAKVPSISVSTSNGHDYYHIMYTLSSENILKISELTKNEFTLNGGQFELEVERSQFPIAAPKCKGNIIVRMPWTNGSQKNSSLYIFEKYELYNSLWRVYKGEGSVDVVIELNPYVNVTGKSYFLTQCNVFFRQADGRYISELGRRN